MEAPLIAPTLRGYQSSWLVPDLLAGLTLVAIAVPEQMATARLVSLPAVAGLYAFIAGSAVFVVLGRSRQVSVGADSTIAPIIAGAMAGVAAAGTPHYADLVSFLALMVGVLVIAVGLLRLGWIAEFLSTPVITGVLAGIAVEIVIRQVPSILGLPGGGTTTIGRVAKIIDQIGRTNGWTVGIAVGVFAIIAAAEHIDGRIPGALSGLIAAVLVSAVFGLKSHGVAVLGPIHGGLPTFGVPSASWAEVRRLVGPAFVIAFVCVAQTAATLRSANDRAPEVGDFNWDLVALGTGSLAAGLSGSFAVNASPPRTDVVAAAGGRSQLASAIAAVITIGILLLATGLLKDLPQASLGAILIFVATRLFRVDELRAILRFDRLEFGLALAALLAVALLGTENGIVVALLLSLADRTRRAARPRDVVLRREIGTEHWILPDIGRPTEDVPGVIVYLLYAPLWYGNADGVRRHVCEMVDSAPEPVRAFVLDADGISDIDYTGAQALGELARQLKERGVATGIARSSHLVHHDLTHSGLLVDIGADRIFPSVEEAVAALNPTT